MAKNNKGSNLLVPYDIAHCVGTKFPKDYYYRCHKNLIARLTLCMPDGTLISVPIYEGEKLKNKIHTQIEHWYKVTKQNPELFDHIQTDIPCPCCQTPLMSHVSNKTRFLWCPNYPSCDYSTLEENYE